MESTSAECIMDRGRHSFLARPARFLAALVLLGGMGIAGSGCATTGIVERDRIASPEMRFDADGSIAFLRGKVEAAREGALGGYGGAAAGGCGCQ